MKRRIAVFVSGTGRHLENFADQIRAGELDAEIGLLGSNKAGVLALERAERLELPALVLDPGRELSDEVFSAQAFEAVERAECGTVLLAGFLRKLDIPER